MVSSLPGIMSSRSGMVMSVLGLVGAVVGAVVGGVVGRVVGAVVGRVAGTVLGVVVAAGVLLRQPARTHRDRTAAKEMQRNFFMWKPPENTDFTASISMKSAFTLEKTVPAARIRKIF